jgi:hypothetical protein
MKVIGVFQETRHQGTYNFKNEIDTSKPRGSVDKLL